MLQDALRQLVVGQNLTREHATAVMERIMRGEATDAQIGALLAALRMKGVTVDEVTGFATAMRAHAVTVHPSRSPLIDTCGTGGSSFRVFNVSTAAAFIASAAGLAVAKHGNRAASGVCGSADVLEAAGVKVEITPDQCAECIDTIGIGFLYARSHHPSMRHVSAARREIGIRSVFNLLGPLTNPAGATSQVMGVYDADECELAISALKELGSARAVVIHAEPGIDELSTFSNSHVWELRDGRITKSLISPDEFGLTGRKPEPEHVAPANTPAENVHILREALGEGPATPAARSRRGLAAVNAAAALRVGGMAEQWKDSVSLANEIIASGSALRVLDNLVKLTAGFT